MSEFSDTLGVCGLGLGYSLRLGVAVLGLWPPAELLLAHPQRLQLFKESSHQVEKQRPCLPYHVASRQFNTRATQLPPALTSCRVLQPGGLGDWQD